MPGRKLAAKRLEWNSEENKDDNISDISSPKGVDTPKPMEMPRYSVQKQENDKSTWRSNCRTS